MADDMVDIWYFVLECYHLVLPCVSHCLAYLTLCLRILHSLASDAGGF